MNDGPKLTVYAPCAELLKDGYVYMSSKVENLTILPLYNEVNGTETTKLVPKIGHLHVMVDKSGWSWIHALNEPIYFGPLKKGKHTVRVELVDAAHSLIEAQKKEILVP